MKKTASAAERENFPSYQSCALASQGHEAEFKRGKFSGSSDSFGSINRDKLIEKSMNILKSSFLIFSFLLFPIRRWWKFSLLIAAFLKYLWHETIKINKLITIATIKAFLISENVCVFRECAQRNEIMASNGSLAIKAKHNRYLHALEEYFLVKTRNQSMYL